MWTHWKKGVIHFPDRLMMGGTRFHHATRNDVQVKTEIIYEIFHLIFSEHG
jgi:hypothetical protein